MTLDLNTLKRLVYDAVTVREDEISCPECFEQLDTFVEKMLVGKNAVQAMPLVQDHLSRCVNCHQEFEALLAALHGMHGKTTH